MLTSKIQKTILLLGIVAFVIVGIFGIGIGSFGMTADAGGQMSSCPFMGVAAICKMNPLEHIDAWQSMFTALPSKEIFVLALLLLLAVFSVFLRRDFWNTRWIPGIPVSNHRQYSRCKVFIVRNELQEAISSGILHPKIF